VLRDTLDGPLVPALALTAIESTLAAADDAVAANAATPIASEANPRIVPM
jgi:hypothetical protein